MDTKVKYTEAFIGLTKSQIAVYSGIAGALVGMFIQSTIGLSGLLLLGGFYLIMKFFKTDKSKGSKE